MKPEFDDYRGKGGEALGGGSRAVSWVVLALAASGFVSLAWYAYQSGTESITASTDVPVVEADHSPVKVPPENPGGEQFAHQDKTIYNTISGDQPDAKVEKLLPEPEKPIIPPKEAVAASEAEPETQTWMNEKLTKVDNQDSVAQAPAPASETPKTAEPAKEPSKVEAPKPEVVVAAPVATPAPAAPAEAPKVVEAPKAETPAPAAKPAIVAAPPKPAPAPSVKTTGSWGGAYKIQLGAYKSQAEAETNWGKISHKFSGVLNGAGHMVVRADLPNGTYYRLRATGFASPESAKAACTSISAQKQPCFYAGK